MIDAIAFKYDTGTPWIDLPERFGSCKVRSRLWKWTAVREQEETTWTGLSRSTPQSSCSPARRRACQRGSRLGAAPPWHAGHGPGGQGALLAGDPPSSAALRIRAVVPQPADQMAARKCHGRPGGRPLAFDR